MEFGKKRLNLDWGRKMKKTVKLLALLVILFLFTAKANAKVFQNPIESVIKQSDISKTALISVSFKEIDNGKKVFEMNSNTPMSPASIQKIATLLPSINTLGSNYEFKTQLYKNKDNYLYIKLGADPYFTTANLKNMIRSLASYKIASTKAFYIDDSILDSNEWGEGWEWDNDMNPLMPRFGAYNMDRNLITINICPTIPGAPADISTSVFYPTAFINNVITSDATNVKLERKNYISPDVINADGTVSHDYNVQIPVNYPRRYFILRLEEILRKQKVSYYGDFNRLKLPKNTTLVTEASHPFSLAIDDILKNSNNAAAETVFKLAGGKYINGIGSVDAAVEMFNDYYKKIGVCTDNIKIVDGSGVSKNNLVTADFMTEILLKESQSKDFDEFKKYMASPGEGTLKDRMLYFKDNLKAKTGTLTNISSITGYLTAKNGKIYAFCIIVNDPKSKSADKKAFEEYVLRKAFDTL
jgi:serine-type D-Ala-D-Ala carboxypeptidase/endopeptidase (penicillin-binding protein 4)